MYVKTKCPVCKKGKIEHCVSVDLANQQQFSFLCHTCGAVFDMIDKFDAFKRPGIYTAKLHNLEFYNQLSSDDGGENLAKFEEMIRQEKQQYTAEQYEFEFEFEPDEKVKLAPDVEP